MNSCYDSCRRGVNGKVSDFSIGIVFEGVHFNSFDEIKFKEVLVSYTNLYKWFYVNGENTYPLKLKEERQDDGRIFEVTLKRECDWSATSESGIEITHWRDSKWVTSAPKVIVEFSDGIRMQSLKPTSLGEFFSINRRFMSLASVLANGVLEISRIGAAADHDGRPISVYGSFQSSFLQLEKEAPFLSSACPLSSESFGEILEEWLKVYDKIESMVGGYISALYNRNLSTRNKFLELIHALEDFHRTFYGGSYMPEEEWEGPKKALATAIPSSLGKDFRNKLKNMLRYGYEYSQRKRLADIVAKLPQSDSFSDMRKNDFVNKSVDTRNHFVHGGEKPEGIFDHNEQILAIESWRKALLALLLQEIGVNVDGIERAVRNLPKAQYIWHMTRGI